MRFTPQLACFLSLVAAAACMRPSASAPSSATSVPAPDGPVVYEDADLDSVVEGLVDAIWFNQGQVCCAGECFIGGFLRGSQRPKASEAKGCEKDLESIGLHACSLAEAIVFTTGTRAWMKPPRW